MRQSNGYIIFYASILSVVCAGLLVGANLLLKDRQTANVELEQKTSILATVMTLEEGSDIEKLYRENVREFVVNSEGEVVSGMTPKQVAIATEYKKPAKERMLPVYEFRNKQDTTQLDYVVFPVFGAGLWDAIWGYVALESDMNTIKGVKFEHKGETPGLGARITDAEVQNRYPGKEVYENGKLVSITMMKGEGNDYSGDKHKVDGLSGATLTAKGVNNMLTDYLAAYEGYINKHKKK
ncbi:MAG TPA: NADH:ubiquinone reductase (Na(+)-transporting) subunit C [Ohtaekwangia sp.]|nr:NADH:ubiquinone reductase (Na(+)-transporting) subunit C [Ohtaekwangia sp.]